MCHATYKQRTEASHINKLKILLQYSKNDRYAIYEALLNKYITEISLHIRSQVCRQPSNMTGITHKTFNIPKVLSVTQKQ